jgi:hypothetical protein
VTELPAPLRRLAAARNPSPRARRVLSVLALALFVGGLAVAIPNLDVSLAELAIGPLLLVAVVLTPLTIVANAAELRVMADATQDPGRRLGWLEAIRVVVLATAANVLPIPGAALVRIQALRTRGATAAAATGINLAGAGAWIGTGLIAAGVALLGVGGWRAVLALVVGIVACVVAGIVTVRVARPGRWRRSFAMLLVVELLATVVHGVRLLAVLAALQVSLGLVESLVIAVSAPLSAAAGIFPSGIGLAEALAALLGPLVGVAAAAALTATALNRVIGLVVTAPLALLFGGRTNDPSTSAASDGPDAGADLP